MSMGQTTPNEPGINPHDNREYKLKCIEVGTKAIGALVVVASLVIAFRDHIGAREKEFKVRLYQKQIDLYQEWVATAARVTFSEDLNSATSMAEMKKFQRLFWGELAVLKDKTIVRAGNNFQNLVYNVRYHGADKKKLQTALHHLGQACRKSLSCSVGLELRPHSDAGSECYACNEYEAWEEKIEQIKPGPK